MPWAIAIHGGAGLIRRNSLSTERERACRDALHRIVAEGAALLDQGAPALDAASAAVVALEDCPLFNAGRGSVLASDGTVELDAAVMDGRDRSAGAITGARTTRNPILLANTLRTTSPHVLLAGPPTDAMAKAHGLEQVENSWFITPERRDQLADMQQRGAIGLDHDDPEPDRYGTVGAVAVDLNGHVAAATSTGGMANKQAGRVGDTPIIGAGTFAWDQTCAVSGTGHGEPFIRLGVASRCSAWMDIGGLDLQAAGNKVIQEELLALGGRGGLIAVDRDGHVAMPFNTGGMFRGAQQQHGRLFVGIW